MNLQIGKVYKLKTGMLCRLQGISRSIVHHRENEVRHFVEVSFQAIGPLHLYTPEDFKVILPLNEILRNRTSDDKQMLMNVADAIANGSSIPLTSSLVLSTPD